MLAVTEVKLEQSYYQCPVCKQLHETQKRADHCFSVGLGRQAFHETWTTDALYWYEMKSRQNTNYYKWALPYKFREIESLWHGYARGSCAMRQTEWFCAATASYFEDDNWAIFGPKLTMWEGFTQHNLLPNLERLHNYRDKFTAEQWQSVLDFEEQLKGYVMDKVNDCTMKALHDFAYGTIMQKLWCACKETDSISDMLYHGMEVPK